MVALSVAVRATLLVPTLLSSRWAPLVEASASVTCQLMLRVPAPMPGPARAHQPGRVLAIVSPRRGDGRSHAAANLAAAFSQLGERTVLVDADLRAPRLHRLFDLADRPDRPGLSVLLADPVRVPEPQRIDVLPCLALLPGGKGQAHGQRLDVAGAVTITASLMLAVYAIVNGNAAGWTSMQSLGLLGAAAALLAAFLFIESHVAAPLVPLPLLRLRNLAISNVVGVLWAASMFAWFFLSALYMQLVLGYDAMQVGLAFLPSNLIMAGCSLGLSAWVVMRFGICRTLGWGLLLAAVGLALFALAPTEGRFVIHVLPGMLLLGVGAGIALNPLLLAAMGDVKPEDSGLASGVVNTAFMMGGALGLAILASLACGHHVYPDNIPTRGIRDITVADIKAAEKLDSAIKLIAWYNEGGDGQMAAGVEPMLVSNSNQLAGVDDVFNAVLMKGDMLGDVVFYGKGAGKLPTASAVVADVIDALKEGVKVHDSLFWKPAEKPEGLLEDRNTYPWYLRVTGVAAALLPSVAGAGHVVFEDNGEAAYLVDAATSADIAAVTEKIEVLGGKVALAMKKLED